MCSWRHSMRLQVSSYACPLRRAKAILSSAGRRAPAWQSMREQEAAGRENMAASAAAPRAQPAGQARGLTTSDLSYL